MTDDQFDKLSAQIYATQVLAVALAKLSSEAVARQQFRYERDILETVLLNLAIPEKRLEAIRQECARLEDAIWGEEAGAPAQK